MSDIRAYEQPGEAGFGDYVQLLKPRVMSLVVFTALVGLLVAPVGRASGDRFCLDPVHRARGRRFGRAEHVVGCRYRRRDAPHQGAVPCLGQGRGRRGAGRGPWPFRVSAVVMLGLATNLAFGGAAGLYHLLLRGRLFGVAEAPDSAEHRDRWGCRGLPADDRLGLAATGSISGGKRC
jgi:hypothetical protein